MTPDPLTAGPRTFGLAATIDHTMLAPGATAADILRFCDEAREHGFRSVCVNPVHAARVSTRLLGCAVGTCVVVGFPLGASLPETKAREAADAMQQGATEIDAVIALWALKGGDLVQVGRDLAGVRGACAGATLKVIIETCLLTDEEKRLACRIARDEGAEFVKTSTGFSTGGATVADVVLMHAEVGPAVRVKASGGVRTREFAQALIDAGASRIGTSSGLALVGRAGGIGAY